MRDGSPSRTAVVVAAYRLEFERLPSAVGDAESDQRLARDVVAGFEFEPDERMAAYLRVRTSFFDRVVVNGIERGVTQVAAIGAGYDGRALRYAKPGVRWFEVDHPATQGDKLVRLERLEIPTPGVTFVGVDLLGEDVAVALVDAGFEPDAPSLVLCEGVAVYLDAVALEAMLARLRSVATAGTRLALSAGVPGADPARRERFASRVARLGEPVGLAGVDVERLLSAARWRAAELSERARRAGMIVGLPVWEPGAPPTISRIGSYLERTFDRRGMDGLADHLAETYGIAVTGIGRLDVGVVRVDRADGPAWVARVFPAARPVEVTRGDADVLRFLAGAGYPAERVAAADPVSEHHGQAVLVTEFVGGKAAQPTQATFRALGELLGRLHTLPEPPPGRAGGEAPRRAGGAWHHLALEGGPGEEIAGLRALLDARGHVGDEGQDALAVLREEVARLDDLHDLPARFTHPDFVAANTIVAPAGGPVIVDWAGAGVGPRLWTLAFLLWSAGMAGPRQVDATVQGYRRHVSLEPAELDRLEPAVAARPLIFDAWSYATGRQPLSEVVAKRGDVGAKALEVAARARAAFAA
jgi:methyltransferase (TIGR00027 family)